MTQLQLAGPSRVFNILNGSAEKSLGKAEVRVYNPKIKEICVVNFGIVPGKHTPILRSTTAQKLRLIATHTGNYEVAAVVQPVLPSRERNFEKYPKVLKTPLGKLDHDFRSIRSARWAGGDCSEAADEEGAREITGTWCCKSCRYAH